MRILSSTKSSPTKGWAAAVAAAALVLAGGVLTPAAATDEPLGEITWISAPVGKQVVAYSTFEDCLGNRTVTPGKVSVTEPGTTSPTTAQVRYEWLRGDEVIGTGPDLIHTKPLGPVVLRATATADGFAEAVSVSEPITLYFGGGIACCGADQARINGRPKVGATLRAKISVVGTVTKIRWFRDGARIPGATTASYRASRQDANHRLVVKVSVRKRVRVVTVRSAPTAKIRR